MPYLSPRLADIQRAKFKLTPPSTTLEHRMQQWQRLGHKPTETTGQTFQTTTRLLCVNPPEGLNSFLCTVSNRSQLRVLQNLDLISCWLTSWISVTAPRIGCSTQQTSVYYTLPHYPPRHPQSAWYAGTSLVPQLSRLARPQNVPVRTHARATTSRRVHVGGQAAK